MKEKSIAEQFGRYVIPSILVYADPFVFTPLFLVTLPLVTGIAGIWFAYPATQIALTLLALVLKKKNDNVQTTSILHPLS